MERQHSRCGLLLCLLLLALTTNCGDDATAPANSIVGTWDFIGFSEAGVEAVTTGTWIFRSDRTWSVNGTITLPDQPTEAVSLGGTYELNGDTLDLTTEGVTATWTLEFTGDVVILTRLEPPPANTITLRRQQ